MLKLQTTVNIPTSDFKISPTQKGLIIGSCFAENIGNYLSNKGFDATCNPQGILYNPLSILHGLKQIKSPQQIDLEQLVLHNELYHSMAHHGSFSDTDPQKVLSKVNAPTPNDFDYIIITLGTAFVYKMDGKIVANCHKLPKANFTHTRLSFSEITKTLEQIIELFSGSNIIFTVSPIRHLSDTLIENCTSKSLLRAATAEVVEKHDNCSYFGAYEIMNDELRDYRFYANDMLHPSDQAVTHIIEQFESAYFSDEAIKLSAEIGKFNTLKNHRILHQNTTANQKHIAKIEQTRADLTKRHPFLVGKI